MDFDDPRCEFSSIVSSDDVAALMKLLDPKVLLGTGCRVKKHPDCCMLCAMNEDCSRLPIHIRCRCEPEPFMTFDDEPL
jgi:hypothetical protein